MRHETDSAGVMRLRIFYFFFCVIQGPIFTTYKLTETISYFSLSLCNAWLLLLAVLELACLKNKYIYVMFRFFLVS